MTISQVWETNLYLGNYSDVLDRENLHRLGITATVNVAYDVQSPKFFGKIRSYDVPLSDDFRNKEYRYYLAGKVVLELLKAEEKVFVHCVDGVSRSAAIASLALACFEENSTPREAYKLVSMSRPMVNISEVHWPLIELAFTRLKEKPMIVLLYGLPSAGKTTIATEFQEIALNTASLDGDVLRKGLCSDLGFSAEDRKENLRRTIHCARMLSLARKTVLVSLIAPYEEDRAMAKKICQDVELVDVFVDCPLEICEQRDVKGLYKLARAGKVVKFTGVDDPFEEPSEPTYRIRTHLEKPASVLAKELLTSIWRGEYLTKRNLVF